MSLRHTTSFFANLQNQTIATDIASIEDFGGAETLDLTLSTHTDSVISQGNDGGMSALVVLESIPTSSFVQSITLGDGVSSIEDFETNASFVITRNKTTEIGEIHSFTSNVFSSFEGTTSMEEINELSSPATIGATPIPPPITGARVIRLPKRTYVFRPPNIQRRELD